MTSKERVQIAFNHENTDRFPFQATFTPEFAARLRKEFHLPDRVYEPHNRDWYGYELECLTGQDALQAGVGWFTNYYLKDTDYVDEWGVGWKIDYYDTMYGKGFYTNIKYNPLKEDDSKAMAYKAPDPDRPEMYRVLDRLLNEFGKDYYIIGRVHCTIFESAWALRGLETLMMDMYINPELTEHILTETANYHKRVACNMARMGADMIWLGDDMGTQNSLMIDPEMWRFFLKPKMASIIKAIKKINPNIKVAYHSDGCNYAIIPDLIEIGLDVLNPIQTECMDPGLLKEKYGDKLCFFGGVEVQSTLPMGSTEDVVKEVEWLKKTLGKNGGWLCAPTHHIQMDTPMENFFTLLHTLGIEDRRK